MNGIRWDPRFLASMATLIAVVTASAVILTHAPTRDSPIGRFDQTRCPDTWWSSVNDLQGGPGGATSEIEAILAEADSAPFSSELPEDARRTVTTSQEDGFLLTERDLRSASFTLMIDGVPRGNVTIERFGEHSFGASGSTWCVD